MATADKTNKNKRTVEYSLSHKLKYLFMKIANIEVQNIKPGFTKQIHPGGLVELIASIQDFDNRVIILHDLRLLLKLCD